MADYRQRYEHYLMLKVSAASVAPTQAYLSQLFDGRGGDFFRCTAQEGSKAFLHRFAALALLSEGASAFDIGWRMALCGAGFGFFRPR